MRLPSPGFLFSALLQVSRQFPGPMIFAVLGVIACFGMIDYHYPDDEDANMRNWMVCQLGLPILTALAAFAASKEWSVEKNWMLQCLGITAMVGIWFWLDPKADNFDKQRVPQYLALLLTGHLAVAVAPFLNQRSVRNFWEYNRQLFANFVVGAAFSLILFAGLALAVAAVDNLFSLNINDRIYPKLFVLLAGIFNTAYFLYHFPSLTTANPETGTNGGSYNWVFRNLCKYILIPIVILYFIILYAYGAKIGIEWSLPKGWVSSLVIGFSVAGIFAYLLNFYLEEEDNSLIVKSFKRWFWWVLLPLTLLLFIAIGKRIGDYGVTEARFLVAQLGVWITFACLYFAISKNDNIKFIPISLGLFALSWAFGPLSAFAVAERSQKNILTGILERNGRFENGKLKPGNSLLTEPEQEQVSAAILFLKDRQALDALLPQPVDSAWYEVGGLLRWLNIESAAPVDNQTITLETGDGIEVMTLKGYDMAYLLEGEVFRLSKSGTLLEWHGNDKGQDVVVESFNLQPFIKKWTESMPKNESYVYKRVADSNLAFELIGRKGSIRCILSRAQFSVDQHHSILTDLNGWVLLKTFTSTN